MADIWLIFHPFFRQLSATLPNYNLFQSFPSYFSCLLLAALYTPRMKIIDIALNDALGVWELTVETRLNGKLAVGYLFFKSQVSAVAFIQNQTYGAQAA